MKYKPLLQLPADIQRDWMAVLYRPEPTESGCFRLVNIRRTKPQTFEDRRIVVLVLDEEGVAVPNVPVAFSYSTADQYIMTEEYKWTPPVPHRAFIVSTQGGGQIDQIQGSPVKKGQPGGMTVYCLTPEYSSDYVTGCGMLGDHTGLHLTFQWQRTDYVSLTDRMNDLEARIKALEGRDPLATKEFPVY